MNDSARNEAVTALDKACRESWRNGFREALKVLETVHAWHSPVGKVPRDYLRKVHGWTEREIEKARERAFAEEK